MMQTAKRAFARKWPVFLFFFVVAGADLPSAPKAKAAPFCDAPKTISFDVASERAADKRTWIDLSADVETVFRCPVEPILEVLWDFESSPKVFKRIESVKVRSDDGRIAVTEQKSAFRVMGIGIESSLVFENELIRNGGESAEFMFRTIEVDEATKSVTGSWRLEEFEEGGAIATRVRYSVQSLVESTIPGQEWIIRSFGEGDVKNIVLELASAVSSALSSRAGG